MLEGEAAAAGEEAAEGGVETCPGQRPPRGSFPDLPEQTPRIQVADTHLDGGASRAAAGRRERRTVSPCSPQEAGAAAQEGVSAGDQGDAAEGEGEAAAAGAGRTGERRAEPPVTSR